MKKIIKWLALLTLGIVLVATLGLIVWAKMAYRAELGELALASDEAKNDYRIDEKKDYWQIVPNDENAQSAKYKDAGLIFYPGAKVEPKAYFCKLSSLANGEAGKIKVFITKPTLNLAVFNINQADKVIADHPEIKKWIVGGHSLGGAISCEYAKNHVERISELWLFASYCRSDISNLNINGVSIHGSLDGVLTPQKLSDNRKNLPAPAVDFEIQGMNHAQISNYGKQSGDRESTKSDEDVRQEMIKIFSKLITE